MSDRINVLKKASSLDTAPQFDGYTRVVINVGTDDEGNFISFAAGDESGRTLEFSNEWGNQEMANNILQQILGYRYQPLNAEDVILDPSAELGDGIVVNGVYSGIFARATTFNRLMPAHVEAPTDEEIEHEYAVEKASDRQYTRFVQNTKSLIRITNQQIALEVENRQSADSLLSAQIQVNADNITTKVSKQGGNGSTFGWTLTDSEWSVWSGSESNTILRATPTGLEVKGKITATSGQIGGFSIESNYLSYNSQYWGGNNSTGIYIGQSGIQCGSYNNGFRVDNNGNITANNLNASNANLSGTLIVDGSPISASVLRSGAQSAYTNGGTWSTGAQYGYNFDSMKYGGGNAFPINASSFRINGTQYAPQTIAFVDGLGNQRYFYGVVRQL